MSGDGVEVAHPLFREEGDGAIPISPLQFTMVKIPSLKGLILNESWHSRLPQIRNSQGCLFLGLQYSGEFWGVAILGRPIARLFNDLPYLELRRMALRDGIPKNTGSRFLRLIAIYIRKHYPLISKLISYQDSAVHHGTIYKAAGWKAIGFRKGGRLAWDSPTRKRNLCQADGDKIRWELAL